MDILKPRGSLPIRKPTDNNMQHGQIFNPPRFSQFGGGKDGTAINSSMYKNKMTLEKPGGTKKVIWVWEIHTKQNKSVTPVAHAVIN